MTALCKDCRYLETGMGDPATAWPVLRCKHHIASFNLVSGIPSYPYATDQRGVGMPGDHEHCGAEGKNFQRRDP
jgi:hypothetical protein